jgi:hypothetical protein
MSSGPYTMSSTPDQRRLLKSARVDRRALLGERGRRDHRTYARRPIECDLWLIDGAAQAVLRCKTDNVSDAGLHVVAPLGFGLAVGQRFEVRMAAPHTSGPMSSNLADSLGYATVIRTQIKVGDHRPDRVGCALRFDVPQLVPA